MAAYLIADEEVIDAAGIAEYGRLARPTVEEYGGKVIIATDQSEVLEGEWQPKRLVVIVFESLERAKEWYESPEYRQAIPLRHRAAKTNMVLLEGR